MRERLKEPRKGSEIDPEIVCVQGVGALHKVNLSFFIVMLEPEKGKRAARSTEFSSVIGAMRKTAGLSHAG